jgi:hypothetical protein
MADHIVKRKRDGTKQVAGGSGATDKTMDLKSLLVEIEERLIEAAQRRFTGEIRLTFNVSQGGFSTIYIEKERENLVRNREGKNRK